MRRFAIAAARCARSVARRCAGDEAGFTMIEVLTAIVVLAIGLGAVFQLMIVATHATQTNKLRQAETSLAREVTEDTRSLAYTQLTASGLASALQPIVPGSMVSGSSLQVQRTLSTSGGQYALNVTFTACSLDDPADGYGNHSQLPISGGSWCPDVAASGTQDSNPDDYKRVSVTVSPASGRTTPTVQQTILVYAKATHGPAVTCVSVDSSCPGVNQSKFTGSSMTFNVTTTVPAASIKWLVNGSLPVGSGIDPYTPSGTTSQFTWNIPTVSWNNATYTVDGTYTISAVAYDANGNQGTISSLQVTVNEHMALPPTTVYAGYDASASAIDVQWVPSTDRDVQYYIVYQQYGSGALSQVAGCTHVVGLTCTDTAGNSSGTDPSAPAPVAEPGTCTYSTTPNLPGMYQSFTTPDYYYVVGVDTSNGQPRPSTFLSQKIDANACDHPPSAPTNLQVSGGNGNVTLNWSLPSAPMDQDPGDNITQWRIYRWPGGTRNDPGNRLDQIGEQDASSNAVTTYTDRSADPGGAPQSYCITAVDYDLQESLQCSNTVTG